MHDQSPISHVHKVKCPTIVLIGLKDLRVPPYQGFEWSRALKANGVHVEQYEYPEGTLFNKLFLNFKSRNS